MNLTPKTFREKRLMKEAWTSGQARRAPGVVLAQVQELVIKLYRKEEARDLKGRRPTRREMESLGEGK